MKQNVQKRLNELRRLMKDAGISAVVVPQGDPHLSEYMSDHWQARRMLSGFTGSAGDLVVTLDKALLWTDSRYFLQAANQLADTEIILMKDGLPDTPSISTWLGETLKSGETIGIDGMVFSYSAVEDLYFDLASHGIKLNVMFDVIDQVWTDRPALPKDKVFVHDVKFAGKDAKTKISEVLAEAAAQQANAVFISALDEIAWTLNIRSTDVKYNPVVTSFLYLSTKENVLFVDLDKIDEDVKQYLSSQGVSVAAYNSVKSYLSKVDSDAKVLLDTARTCAGIAAILEGKSVKGKSAVASFKACKNDVQLAGTRNAMIRDGVAMVKSLYEIKQRVQNGVPTTEMDVAEILRVNRSAGEYYFDESFGTIAGYGPHGAIVHYEADEESNSELKPEGLLLIDSGAQYLDGTTDITRTISLSDAPTAEEKRDFTLVMKGHIALGSVIFPEGTVGAQLDALARQFLWAEGLSYLHGTGHGVGHFLNVHEGPQSIRLNYVPAALVPGMITSNEPGLYREGVHGIRCENLVVTVNAMTTEFGKFYKFETLTLCPFDNSLMDTSLLSDAEIKWYNAYQARVCDTLSPYLEGDIKAWLINNTQPIAR